ncbi:DMT family transporter [Xylanibacillus composti]|uniref:Putative transporter YetK n=1 Tax=Xylanibacillus composti TaxID=1572762 RepID=A0A8J4H358_9BACL|nr:DMT family transporter [Xylanibacillus composti]MDT9726203.1 DMT family transporter [Xylanibacillus composti]GIQ68049.1 putative transporter YetK [Xylanibacillus composti]
MNNHMKAYLAMIVAMTTVGSSFVVGKWIVEAFPIYLASGLRYGLASALLLPLLYLAEKRLPKVGRKDMGVLFLQSLTGVFGFSVCLLYGLQYTTATESGIITSTTPMVIALISFFFLKERLSSRQWLGILFAVFGIAAIHLLSGDTQEIVPGVPAWVGTLLIMAAVVGEALFTIFGKVLSYRLSPLAIATLVTVLGFVMFLPFAIYEAMSFDFTQPTAADWMYIVYYAVVVTVVGFALWYYGVSKVPASTSAVFTGVIAISALLLSYLFLKETFHWGHLAGALFVLSGIWITARRTEARTIEPSASSRMEA